MAKNVTDAAFVPHDADDKGHIVELFIVAKLTNGDCHLVVTEPDIDGEILDFLDANCANEKGNISLMPEPMPILLTHDDGRRFW